MRAHPLRLQKYGNGSCVTIPRALVRHLGWQLGEYLMVELLEDQSVRVRRLAPRDLAPPTVARYLADQPATVKP